MCVFRVPTQAPGRTPRHKGTRRARKSGAKTESTARVVDTEGVEEGKEEPEVEVEENECDGVVERDDAKLPAPPALVDRQRGGKQKKKKNAEVKRKHTTIENERTSVFFFVFFFVGMCPYVRISVRIQTKRHKTGRLGFPKDHLLSSPPQQRAQGG